MTETDAPTPDELLACPFCGGAAVGFYSGDVLCPTYWVQCRKCQAGVGAVSSREEANAAWNTRAALSSATRPEPVASLKAVSLEVGQVIDFHGHRWEVEGVHLGAVGQESLVQLKGLSHEPGWTGPWEFHPMLFVPVILMNAALNASPAQPEPAPSETDGEERWESWSDFEGGHLTDGKGNAAAEVYARCRAAHDAAWPQGRVAAQRAALAALRQEPAPSEGVETELQRAARKIMLWIKCGMPDQSDNTPTRDILKRDLLTLIEQSLRAPTDSGWRDIESAPKDGTDVLLCTFIDGHLYEEPATGRWNETEWEPSWQGSGVIEYQGDFGTDWKAFGPQPTHWQPLPTPPAALPIEGAGR